MNSYFSFVCQTLPRTDFEAIRQNLAQITAQHGGSASQHAHLVVVAASSTPQAAGGPSDSTWASLATEAARVRRQISLASLSLTLASPTCPTLAYATICIAGSSVSSRISSWAKAPTRQGF